MNILIFSEYEPDDFLALWILVMRYASALVTLVITENSGETLQAKCEDAAHFFPSWKVLRGASSDKKRNFAKTVDAPDRFIESYNGLLEEAAPDIVFGLAPIRDIVHIVSSNPTYFSKTTAYFFGGFNFACLTSTRKDIDWSTFFEKHFEKVIVFEKNLIFEQDFNYSFTMESGPFMKLLWDQPAEDARAVRLRILITSWNRHIYEKMISDISPFEKLQAINKKNALRKLHLLKTIVNSPEQMVAADPIVSILADENIHLHSRPVSFVLNESGHFSYVYNPASTVFLFDASPYGTSWMDHDKAIHEEVESKMVSLFWG